MKNLSKTSKIVLSLTFISFSLWVGSYLGKNLIFFQFFDPETMSLRKLYELADFSGIFHTIFPVLTLNLISYITFVVLFILFVVKSGLNLRQNGWLFISLLIVVFTFPIEMYIIIKYDINFVLDINSMATSAQSAIQLINQRVAKFGMFSLINLFSNLSIILFFIFRPLTKNEN